MIYNIYMYVCVCVCVCVCVIVCSARARVRACGVLSVLVLLKKTASSLSQAGCISFKK